MRRRRSRIPETEIATRTPRVGIPEYATKVIQKCDINSGDP